MAEIRQALYERLHELEDEYAVAFSQGATLYINPTNGQGSAVSPRRTDGRALSKVFCDGPYRSRADELKI